MKHKPFWMLIAREGETTDGRYVSAELLISLAKGYSTEIKTAIVHTGCRDLSLGVTLGEIVAAKTETENDEVCLYVKFEPNDHWFNYLPASVDSIAVFPSMECLVNSEPLKATAGVGDFIVGVSLTTQPAIRNLEPLNKYMVKE